MNLSALAEQVTGYAVAVLSFIAAAVVVVRLVRAFVGRRRAQLVVTEIADTADLPASVTAGLSSLLRAELRRRLNGPSAPSGASLNTVGDDMAGGLVTFGAVKADEFLSIQEDILQTPRRELLSMPRDELASVSGGIRAVAPTQAEGFIGALSVALPRQRGLLVTATPLTRQIATLLQTGLTIDIGPLGRAAQASATFWSDGAAVDPNQWSVAQRTQLQGIVPPSATWIALQVIGMLGIDGTRRQVSPFRKKTNEARRIELRALRNILTAQLAAYAMNQMHGKSAAMLGFADQALEDAHQAELALPDYHRPHYMVGVVHDHRGAGYAALSAALAAQGASGNDVAMLYASSAREAFDKAARAFRQAERLLQARNTPTATAAAHRVRVRRLQAELQGSDGRTALLGLDNFELVGTDENTRFNEACLFAIAAAESEAAGQQQAAQRHRKRAWGRLVDVLVDNPRLGGWAVMDVDLARGLPRDELVGLAAVARAASDSGVEVDRVELRARLVATLPPRD
jgi:hypothetical protein